MCQCVEILLPLLKSSCVPVLAAGLATKDGRGRGVARTRRHESRLLASTSLIAAPAHVTRVSWVSPAQLVSTCLYRLCWGTYISCSINCVPSPSETPATAQLHETMTLPLQSAGFRYFSEYLFHSLKMSRIINHAVYLFKVLKDHIRTFSPSQGPLLKIYLALTHQKHC